MEWNIFVHKNNLLPETMTSILPSKILISSGPTTSNLTLKYHTTAATLLTSQPVRAVSAIQP